MTAISAAQGAIPALTLSIRYGANGRMRNERTTERDLETEEVGNSHPAKTIASSCRRYRTIALVPAIAMQFTSEVPWGPGDFVVAGGLLLGTGAFAVLGLDHVSSTGKRIGLIVGLALGLALVWAELAVGTFP